MFKLKPRSMSSRSPVTMIAATGAGAVLFTLIAGGLIYTSTQRLISAAAWVDHTREVLNALQSASHLLDDIEQNGRLYSVGGSDGTLLTARLVADQFAAIASRIGVLVSDNRNQAQNVEDLVKCSSDLSHNVDALKATGPFLKDNIRPCRNILGRMSRLEQRLLAERSARSQHSSDVSFTTELTFVASSLLTLMTLFGFLLRDAVLRQRIGQDAVLANERLAAMVKTLEDQANESKLLTAFRDELQLCVDLKQVYRSAANGFCELLPGSSGSIAIINSSRNLTEVACSWGTSVMGSLYPANACCGLRSGHPRWREPGNSEVHCTHFSAEPPERYFCSPIVAHGDTLGVLYVQCDEDDVCAIIRKRMDGFQQLLQLTSMAIASLNLRTKLESQSIRDPLTGLFNRHFMQIALERELSRANRRNSILAVFMLDVDHFKVFNDTWGHAAGDAVLKATADAYLTLVRTEDIVCRYGGEEFTIILPDITPETAYARAESIRLAIANLRVPPDKENYGEVTLSIGIALYPNDGRVAEHLLHRADQALYTAKRRGRNQVCFSDAGVLAVES
jgi:diguanylate cyclase (GGDEF)-like protein